MVLKIPTGTCRRWTSLLSYKCGQGFELGTWLAARAGLELGASELEVQHSNRSAMLQFILGNFKKMCRLLWLSGEALSLQRLSIQFTLSRNCLTTTLQKTIKLQLVLGTRLAWVLAHSARDHGKFLAKNQNLLVSDYLARLFSNHMYNVPNLLQNCA